VTLATEAVPDDRYGMNLIRVATVGAAAMFMGGVLPSVASATDYCVYPNQSCGANNTQYLQPTLELAASTGDADRILLGAHEYLAPPNPTAFSYTGNSPVEIVGSGRGQTVLTGSEGAVNRVLNMDGGSGSSVHDLTILIPPKVAQEFRGLITKNLARRIEIVEDPLQSQSRIGAILSEGGVLEDSSVTLNPEEATTGALFFLGGTGPAANTVRHSLVSAATGIYNRGNGRIERSSVTGSNLGIFAETAETTITDSLVRLTGTFGMGIRAGTGPGVTTTVTADGLTIVAPNLPDLGGIQVSTSASPADSVHLALTNSIIRGGATPLAAVAGGQGTATISASYSDYDPSGNIAWGGSISESHVTNVGEAGFDQTAGHGYALLPGSPLLDKGDPDAPQGLDLGGNARVADGNGDGVARRDIGAFELQPAMAGSPPGGGTSSGPAADTKAPVISGFRAARSRLPFAHATRFRWTLSEKARVVVKIQRVPRVRSGPYRTLRALKAAAVEGANRLRFGSRVHGRALRPGRYRAVIRAIDAAGNRSAPRTTTLRVMS
jgi:hypothetical protein